MKNKFALLLLVLLQFVFTKSLKAYNDRIIVFTSYEDSNAVLLHFNKNYLPNIQSFSEDMEIVVDIVEAEEGVPEGLTSLPAIYYIDEQGRKFYFKGRYAELQRLKTFITTHRVLDLKEEALTKQDFFWMKYPRGFEVGLVYKRFPLVTAASQSANNDVENRINNALKKNLLCYKWTAQRTLPEHSKLYYVNIYPYLSEEGIYYLKYELFSQHSCHEPVISHIENAFSGPNIRNVVKELTDDLVKDMNLMMKDTIYSDGLFINYTFPNKSWASFNVKKSVSPTKKAKNKSNSKLSSGEFRVDNQGKPQVFFAFLPPVSHYLGLFRHLNGGLSYNGKKLEASFELSSSMLDMGEESLNEVVRSEQLQINNYATITLNAVLRANEIRFNEKIPLKGTLHLLGTKKEIAIEAMFTNATETSFNVQASFNLDISAYDTLEKPDGPSPANETLFIQAIFNVSTSE